jgi:hypothetical protein
MKSYIIVLDILILLISAQSGKCCDTECRLSECTKDSRSSGKMILNDML